MDTEQLFQFISDLIREHWPGAVFSLVCLSFGAWWGRRRAHKAWTKKEFLNRINISLNILQEGKLQIRTLLESDLETIFLNKVAVEKVTSAIPRTAEDNPMLPIEKEDAWYLLNAVLNEISERFALGNIKRDLGIASKTGNYLICLTYERAGAVRTRKVRAMVVQKERLLNLPQEMPKLESPLHSTRFETLQKMAECYQKEPWRFLEMEISV